MRDRMAAIRSGLFDEWLAYEELEPFGFPLRNLQMAYTLATLSNTIGGGRYVSAKKREPYKLDEFMLRPSAQRAKPRRMSADETAAHVSGVFAMLGARRAPSGRRE